MVDSGVVDKIPHRQMGAERPVSWEAATEECGSVSRWAGRLGPRFAGQDEHGRLFEERRTEPVPVVMEEDLSLPEVHPALSSAELGELCLSLVVHQPALSHELS